MTTNNLSEAQNALEALLLAVRSGDAPLVDLLALLHQSEVVLLLNAEPGPDDLREGRSQPLLLQNANAEPLLAVFTSPERALPMSLAFPTFMHALPVAFSELLLVIRHGVGLVMNPGTALGFEMPAANVQKLQHEALLGDA